MPEAAGSPLPATPATPDAKPLNRGAVSHAEGVVLGFDYGEKRIGVALANTLTRSARALTIIANLSREHRFDQIARLIAEWQPVQLVVGLPCYPDGTPHEMTQLARRFGNQLNGRFDLPVIWVDERYSSVDARTQREIAREAADAAGAGGRTRSTPPARSTGKQRAAIDDEAARVILQQYLDDPFHV